MGGMKEEGSPTKILWGLTYVRGGRGGVKKCSKFADKYYKFCGERGGGVKKSKTSSDVIPFASVFLLLFPFL